MNLAAALAVFPQWAQPTILGQGKGWFWGSVLPVPGEREKLRRWLWSFPVVKSLSGTESETNVKNLALLCHYLPCLKFCIPGPSTVPDTQSASNTYESDSNPSSTVILAQIILDYLSNSYLTHGSQFSLQLHISEQFWPISCSSTCCIFIDVLSSRHTWYLVPHLPNLSLDLVWIIKQCD